MNLRTTAILFSLLCASLLGFFLLQHYGVRTPEEAKELAKWAFPSLNDTFAPVDDKVFTKIIIERHANGDQNPESIEFVKRDDNWRMVAPKDVKTDTFAVQSLLSQIKTAEKKKYTELDESLSAYGLDQPRAEITLYRGDRKSTIMIGDEGPGSDPPVYALSSDSPDKPIAIIRSRIDKAFDDLADFRSKDLLTTGTWNVSKVELTGTGGKTTTLEKKDDQNWQITQPIQWAADKSAADSLLSSLTGIKVERNEDFIADGQLDLAKYGLSDDKTTRRIVLTRKAEGEKTPESEQLTIGKADESLATAVRGAAQFGLMSGGVRFDVGSILAFHNYSAPDLAKEVRGYFAKPADENYIVRISAKHIEPFDKPVDELRSKDLVNLDVAQVDAINIVSGGEALRFRRPVLKSAGTESAAPAQWDLYTDRGKVPTHLKTVPDLIDAINKVELKAATAFLDDSDKQRAWFEDDPVNLGLENPRAELVIWESAIDRNEEGKPKGDGEPALKETVKYKPTIKLQIGRKDEKRGVVYVRRKADDGPESIMAVPDPWAPATATTPGRPASPTQTVELSRLATAGYLYYRDHVLPSFTAPAATQVSYQRQDTQYLAEKSESDGPENAANSWMLKQPVEANAANVDSLLFQLSGLRADQMITDSASEEDMNTKYGLTDQPTLRAVITVKNSENKSDQYTYTIGKLTDPAGPRPNHFYARVQRQPADGEPPDSNNFVFALPWLVVQRLAMELRDPTVIVGESTAQPTSLNFTWRTKGDDNKVIETKLRLVNKAEQAGATKTWQLESLTRDGSDIKAELPKLDTGKVNQLVQHAPSSFISTPNINPLTCERYFTHNGPPEPLHGLDPANSETPPTVVIEAAFDNDTKRTLILGNTWDKPKDEFPGLRMEKYYYGHSPNQANTVFLLPQPVYGPLAKGVDYFKLP